MKIKDYGYMHMAAWDLLLSITAKAMLAAEILRPGQMVCIVPGCLCISRKTSLVRSLVMTYGKDMAFTLVPRTFKLPEELDEWGAWVQAHPEQVSGFFGACTVVVQLVTYSEGLLACNMSSSCCRHSSSAHTVVLSDHFLLGACRALYSVQVHVSSTRQY